MFQAGRVIEREVQQLTRMDSVSNRQSIAELLKNKLANVHLNCRRQDPSLLLDGPLLEMAPLLKSLHDHQRGNVRRESLSKDLTRQILSPSL